MIKVAIQKEGITLGHIYAPNKGVPKYIKQILMDTKGKINSDTVIGGDFNIDINRLIFWA